MRILHPRATGVDARDLPSKTAIATGNGQYSTCDVDDEGYVTVDDGVAETVMDGFERSYGVEYDRGSGNIVGLDPANSSDAGKRGDEPPDEVAAASKVAKDGNTANEDDLEAWANWNEDDWLSLGYQTRKADVEDGLVDDHLQEIIDLESNQSKTVREAAKQRLAELESEE